MTILFDVDSIHLPCTSKVTEIEELLHNIEKKIGIFKESRVRAYRIPNSSNRIFKPFNEYVSVVLRGEISDCYLEFYCSSKITTIKFPTKTEFNKGKILIELFDWVDIFWLVNKIQKHFN